MKSILKITLPALVGLATLFTACQSEPEVGSNLYDKAASSNLPKLYIHDLANLGNQGTLRVVNANGELNLLEDTAKFYVRLSSPLDHDLEVSVAENPSATKAASGVTVLDKGAINILTPTVTIAKGSTVSADPIKVVAQKGNALDTLKTTHGNGATTLTLNATQGVEVASSYANMHITVNYKESNVVENGNANGLTAMDISEYFVYDNQNNALEKLYDGNLSTVWFKASNEGPFTFVIAVPENTNVSAIALEPSPRYVNWVAKSMTVETSEDWNTWTSQGEITRSDNSISSGEPFVVRFTKPVKCTYVRLSNVQSASSRYLVIGEMKVYK